jgi:uncharacterized protein YecT (DUF1311 family)
MSMRFVCVFLALSISTPVFAADPAIEKRYTKDYADCMENGPASEGVQPAMNACAYDEYTRQDGRLNQAYVMVMKRQSTAGKKTLRTLQRAWLQRRDKKCDAERSRYEGGSIAPLIFHTCMTNETINRTLWLERYR